MHFVVEDLAEITSGRHKHVLVLVEINRDSQRHRDSSIRRGKKRQQWVVEAAGLLFRSHPFFLFLFTLLHQEALVLRSGLSAGRAYYLQFLPGLKRTARCSDITHAYQ